MKLLKEGELELFNKAQESRKYIQKSHIGLINIEDINKQTANKYSSLNFETIKIQNEDGIKDVYITMKFKNLTYRNVNRFAETRTWIIAIILNYFSEYRWDITENIKELL